MKSKRKRHSWPYYLVSAVPKNDRMEELGQRLAAEEFVSLRPFGKTVSHSLKNARLRRDGVAVWEEEDYCTPRLRRSALRSSTIISTTSASRL